MNLRQFRLSSLLLAVAVISVIFAATTYVMRQRAATIAAYKAQQRELDAAVSGFVALLTAEGWTVADDSKSFGGSGEWRTHVALTCSRPDAPPLICYVEVMGFVSHDRSDSPTWLAILPMRLSSRGNLLDRRFLALLLPTLDSHAWKYDVEAFVRHLDHMPPQYAKQATE